MRYSKLNLVPRALFPGFPAPPPKPGKSALGTRLFRTNVSFFRAIAFNAFWKFLWLGISAWDFLGDEF